MSRASKHWRVCVRADSTAEWAFSAGREAESGLQRSFWAILIVALLGLIIGQLLGEVVAFPLLTKAVDLGFGPAALNLHVFSLTFGFSLRLSVAGVIGMLAGLFLVLRGGR